MAKENEQQEGDGGKKKTDPPGNGPDDDQLGEAGKRALAKEREARKAAEDRVKELEPRAAKADELENASKSEIEKAAEKTAAAEKRAEEAERKALLAEVAVDKGLTTAQVKRLVGSTKEELEADADEILETFGAKPDPSANGSKTSRKPTEDLRREKDGNDDDSVEETDPAKLAEKIPRL
jgi:hypothetical protein